MRHAADVLVNREMVVGAEEPQAVADDWATEIGMEFPELVVRHAGESAGRRDGVDVVADD